MSDYCSARHEAGWYCLLKKGHADLGETQHLSLDNTQLWKGTAGLPVRWSSIEREKQNESLLNKGEAIRTSQVKGFTGELCGNCGSPNTIRNGKCLLCTECQFSGECG